MGEEFKTCTKCGETKATAEGFYFRKGKASGYCRKCISAQSSERYHKDPKRERERAKKYYEINREKLVRRKREYIAANYRKVRDQNNASKKRNQAKHLDWIRQYHKDYYHRVKKDDPVERLKSSIRKRINYSVRNKRSNSSEILGIDILGYMEHIGRQFTKEMCWLNYGKVWTVDHEIPVSWFNLEDPTQVLEAFNYKNTKPVTFEYNSRKRDRWADINGKRVSREDWNESRRNKRTETKEIGSAEGEEGTTS